MTCALLPLEARLQSTIMTDERPGSEHAEFAIRAALRHPELQCYLPPGHRGTWDWDTVVWSQLQAHKRHVNIERVARNLTPDQRDALWLDPSPEAAAVRRVMR